MRCSRANATRRAYAPMAFACAGILILAGVRTSFGQAADATANASTEVGAPARDANTDFAATQRILAALPERVESIIVTGPFGARRKTLGLGNSKPPDGLPEAAPQGQASRPSNHPVLPANPNERRLPANAAPPAPPPTEDALLNWNTYLYAFVPKLPELFDPATIAGTVFAAGQFQSEGIPGGTFFDGAQVIVFNADAPASIQAIIARGRLKTGHLPVAAITTTQNWRDGKLTVYLASPDRRTLIAATTKSFLDELVVNLGPNAPRTRRFPTLTQVPEQPVSVWGLHRPNPNAPRNKPADAEEDRPKDRYISFSYNKSVPEFVVRRSLTKPASEKQQKEIGGAVASLGGNQSIQWLNAENYEWTMPEADSNQWLFIIAMMGHMIFV